MRVRSASVFEEVGLATILAVCSRLFRDCHGVVLPEPGLSLLSVAFDPIECSGRKGYVDVPFLFPSLNSQPLKDLKPQSTTVSTSFLLLRAERFEQDSTPN